MKIKFNLWDIDREQYFRDVLSLENDKINKWGTLEIRTSNNVEWLQFIGVKDKNGVEIYNGDIVILEEIFWQVYYCERNASFRIKSKNYFSPRPLYPNSFEKRGNVYENPELLDDDKSYRHKTIIELNQMPV